MTHNPLAWVGLAGISADDNAAAQAWLARLHWIMVSVALLSVPAYLLSTADLGPLCADAAPFRMRTPSWSPHP